MAGKANHRGFGHVRKLPSKRYQASYIGPDLALKPRTGELYRSLLDSKILPTFGSLQFGMSGQGSGTPSLSFTVAAGRCTCRCPQTRQSLIWTLLPVVELSTEHRLATAASCADPHGP